MQALAEVLCVISDFQVDGCLAAESESTSANSISDADAHCSSRTQSQQRFRIGLSKRVQKPSEGRSSSLVSHQLVLNLGSRQACHRLNVVASSRQLRFLPLLIMAFHSVHISGPPELMDRQPLSQIWKDFALRLDQNCSVRLAKVRLVGVSDWLEHGLQAHQVPTTCAWASIFG